MSIWVELVYRTEDGFEGTAREWNITGNLRPMAIQAGVEPLLWRGRALRAEHMIPGLENAIEEMERQPEYFRRYDAENGWGTYDQFLPVLRQMLSACRERPKLRVQVS